MALTTETPVTAKKHIKTASDEKAVAVGYWFCDETADHAVNFIENYLRHSKGQFAGEPFILLPWERDELIRPLFGWVRPDGTRRYRRAYIEIPKKNGKSTICAALSLYLMTGDSEPGAEVYSAANDREQASIVYREAQHMVEQSPELAECLMVTPSTKIIADPLTGSTYKALSADAPTKEGLNIHGLIFDELHAMKRRALWDSLFYGGASRRSPLQIAITTAGSDRESICWHEHEYAKGIIDGANDDPHFFGLIYAAEEGDDWKDEKVWKKANPSLGSVITLESFREDFNRANKSPIYENAFKRYRLNIWTEQETRWIKMEDWRKAEIVSNPVIRGRRCFAGLDLATKIDIASFVRYFPEDNLVIPYFWAPSERAWEREENDKVPYRQWAKEGWLKLTRGKVIDYEEILQDIKRMCGECVVEEVAFDRWNATATIQQLADEGIKVVEFGTGFKSMNSPAKEFEALVIDGKIKYDGNPVFTWMVGNLAAEMDASGNIKPSKAKSSEKIDGPVALMMAIGRDIVKVNPKESIYNRRGLRTI